MGDLHDRTIEELIARERNMRVQAISPDRSVCVRGIGTDGVEISIDPRKLTAHTEESLGRELTRAVVSMERARDAAQMRLSGSTTDTNALTTDGASQDEPRTQIQQRIADVDVRAHSPRGVVVAGMRGTGELRFKIRPGTLGRIDVTTEAIAAEAHHAYVDVLERRNREIEHIYRTADDEDDTKDRERHER